MNKYEELVNWINAGTDYLTVAMLSIIYYMTGGLSSEHIADVMTKISMSYDTSTKTLTYNSTAYTIKDLFSFVVANDYPNSVVITYDMLKAQLIAAKLYGYITSAEYTTLLEELNNA